MAKKMLRCGAPGVWLILLAGLASLLPGCGGNAPQGSKGDPKANLPPAKAPAFDPTTALRPTYDFGKVRPPVTAGTGFVVEDVSSVLWFLTAAHVLEPRQWQEVAVVDVNSMDGRFKVQAPGKLFFQGVAFDELPDLPGGLPDTTKDLVVLRLDPLANLPPLKLAAADPKAGDWVWVVGSEFLPEGDQQKAYLCQVDQVSGGTMSLTIRDRFRLRGFSGGPVLNHKREVVGNLLGGDDKAGKALGATCGNIRQRLQEKGIRVQ